MDETLKTLKAENEQLKKQVEAGKNGLLCLTSYLEQLPGSQTFISLIEIWFSEFNGKDEADIMAEMVQRQRQR